MAIGGGRWNNINILSCDPGVGDLTLKSLYKGQSWGGHQVVNVTEKKRSNYLELVIDKDLSANVSQLSVSCSISDRN